MDKSVKKKTALLFILLVACVLPYRLIHITEPLNNVTQFRQAQTATIAKNFYLHGITLLQTELDIFGMGKERYLTLEFPLYEAMVALLYFWFSPSDMWGRLVSVVASVIGGWYFYRLVYVITRRTVLSWLSTFFFFTAPINMYYQQDILIEPTIIATLLIGMYYAVRWIQKPCVSSLILGSIFLTLGFVQKGMYGPFWLLSLCWYCWKLRRGKSQGITFVLFMIILPMIFLYLWQFHVNMINTENGHGYFSTVDQEHLLWNFGTFSDRGDPVLWQFRLRNILTGIFLKPTVALFFLGVLFPTLKHLSGFFYVWLFSQVVYFFIFFRIQSHNNYQMILVPVFAYFIALGLWKTYRMLRIIFQISPQFRWMPMALCALSIMFFLWKSNANAQWNSATDREWYGRLMTVSQHVPKDSWGILIHPGNDWNSVYTYFPGLHLKVSGAEHVTPEQMKTWYEQGYRYMILHEYEKYPDYLQIVKPGHDLGFLKNENMTFELGEYKVFLLKNF